MSYQYLFQSIQTRNQMHAASQPFERVARIAKRINREGKSQGVTQEAETSQCDDRPSVICRVKFVHSRLDIRESRRPSFMATNRLRHIYFVRSELVKLSRHGSLILPKKIHGENFSLKRGKMSHTYDCPGDGRLRADFVIFLFQIVERTAICERSTMCTKTC